MNVLIGLIMCLSSLVACILGMYDVAALFAVLCIYFDNQHNHNEQMKAIRENRK